MCIRDSHICVPMLLTEAVGEMQPQKLHVMVYPNIVADYVNIRLTVEDRTTVNVKIYNIMGQIVKATKIQLLRGNHIIRYSCKEVPAGIYFMNVSVDKFNNTFKLCILRSKSN